MRPVWAQDVDFVLSPAEFGLFLLVCAIIFAIVGGQALAKGRRRHLSRLPEGADPVAPEGPEDSGEPEADPPSP